MIQLLTLTHVLCGAVALTSSAIAILSKLLTMSHRIHIVSGIAFVLAMFGIAATSIPLTIIHPNLFLRMIAIFSLYLALSGWRLAKNRSGIPNILDQCLVWGMTLTGIGMIGTGAWLYTQSGMAIVIIAFGAIGIALSQIHRRSFAPERRNQRIVMHLTLMLGGTVAAWTALTVTQIQYDPPWIPWLAPTAVFLPLIIGLRRKEKRKLAMAASTQA